MSKVAKIIDHARVLNAIAEIGVHTRTLQDTARLDNRENVVTAMTFIRRGNPELFTWLKELLQEAGA